MKMIILMGVRDKELVQTLTSLSPQSSLQEMVTTCRSFEAARTATAAISTPPDHVRAVSTYKKSKTGQGHEKIPKAPQQSTVSCQNCARTHRTGECPATEATCNGCGRQGHWSHTVKCPANRTQCRLCSRFGHFDKVCKTRNWEDPPSATDATPEPEDSAHSCRRVESCPSSTFKTPQSVCVTVTHAGRTARLQMLPDTGSDVTVIGQQHLDGLGIPPSSLRAPTSTRTLTADGSQMAPALGTLWATLTLGGQTCLAEIQVHDGVQTPLLSYSHCRELAIVSQDFPEPTSPGVYTAKVSRNLQDLQAAPGADSAYPTRPFESVSADFFTVAGKSFLIVVDQLSGWPVVAPCRGDTTAAAIRIFHRYFREVGVPVRLSTNGGPLFTSHDIRKFTERWGVLHVASSPHHAGAAVKSVKNFLLKTAPSGDIDNEDFDQGLMELRNTPDSTGRSPAQVLYGRPLRTCLPARPSSFVSEWQTKADDCDRRAADRTEQVKTRYERAHPPPSVHVGQSVRIKNPTSRRWDKVGVVMGIGRTGDFEVLLPSGRVRWRNRRFLYPVPQSVNPPPQSPVSPCRPETRSSVTHPVAPRCSECFKKERKNQ